MKTYNITVNGTVYAVTVEESGAAPAAAPAPAPAAAPAPAPAPAAAPAPAPAAAPAPAPAAAPAPAPAPAAAPAAGSGNAEDVICPMPGTVLDVLVSPGQAVKQGETVLILEAMKMENEIVAQTDGVVAAIVAGKGASVNAGDVLIKMS